MKKIVSFTWGDRVSDVVRVGGELVEGSESKWVITEEEEEYIMFLLLLSNANIFKWW